MVNALRGPTEIEYGILFRNFVCY